MRPAFPHSLFPRFLGILSLTCGTATASVVIDDFSLDSDIVLTAGGGPVPMSDAQPVTIQGQTATRTFSGGAATGDFQARIRDHGFGYSSVPGGAGHANLTYTGFTADLTTTPFVRLDFLPIQGTGSLTLELQSPSTTLAPSPITLNNATAQTFFLDIRQFDGYQDGALFGINQFLLSVQGLGSPPFQLTLDGISFVSSDERFLAIPEPSAAEWMMGGLLGAGAILCRCRRSTQGAVHGI